MNDNIHKAQRLYVEHGLELGTRITCSREHAHYLLNVLKLGEGASVLVFNGRDGEWRARF